MVLTHTQLYELVSSGLISNEYNSVIHIDIASITLHLNEHFTVYSETPTKPFTPPASLKTQTVQIDRSGEYLLPPHGKVLACTDEYVRMPLDLMGFIQTKGSIARGFMTAHLSDGQIDPGYCGRMTLELVNFSDFTYKLVPGMPIAQLFIWQLTSAVDIGYQGRYQNAKLPTSMKADGSTSAPSVILRQTDIEKQIP
jgi:dCTP deaminase